MESKMVIPEIIGTARLSAIEYLSPISSSVPGSLRLCPQRMLGAARHSHLGVSQPANATPGRRRRKRPAHRLSEPLFSFYARGGSGRSPL
ncbi:MAG: hypothetical protein ACXQTG_00910 [Methanoculleaceae archaeon]